MKKRILSILLAVTMCLSLFPAAAADETEPTPGKLSTNIGEQTFKAGSDEWVEFTFSTVANDDAGVMVYGGSDFGKTYEDKIAALEYKAGDQWLDMKGQNFGGSQGFPMADATSTFRVKFTEDAAGEYTFTASMFKAADDSVLCSVEVPFTVEEKVPSALSTNIGEQTFKAVTWAASQEITAGVDATHFAPDAACTRAQAITFLWRAAGCPVVADQNNPFTDVAADAYYYDAVLWAAANGITSGTSATTFSPDAPAPRWQVVTFLYNAAQATHAADSHFVDVPNNAYYAPAVSWAAECGITSGTSATTFSPNVNCTRAQCMTFLYQFLGE